MIVSVHQPHYLPWLGFFDKIDSADTFVLLDTVQYEIREWQNRNKIKTPHGSQWLTVPVKHEFDSLIKDVVIDNSGRWTQKHVNALKMNYSKTGYYPDYAGYFESCYAETWDYLTDLNADMLDFFLKAMGIDTTIVTASSLGVLSDEPNDRIARIVAEVGGDIYLSGSGGRNYFREEPFSDAGVRVVFQEFEIVQYPQLYGSFVPGLSVIDSLFNIGSENTLDIIRKGRRTVL